jgi:2'-5' RNA ligase
MSETERGRRLFFALWPPDEVRTGMEREAARAVERYGGRQIPARNLHATLLFLGQVRSVQIETVNRAATPLGGAPFLLSFDQLEVWPRSNVLCLTCSRPPAEAEELSAHLRRKLSSEFEFREEAFRPHITVARNAIHRRRINEPTAALDWPVSDFVLVESNMTETGSHYSILERWPLSRPKLGEDPENRVEPGSGL